MLDPQMLDPKRWLSGMLHVGPDAVIMIAALCIYCGWAAWRREGLSSIRAWLAVLGMGLLVATLPWLGGDHRMALRNLPDLRIDMVFAMLWPTALLLVGRRVRR